MSSQGVNIPKASAGAQPEQGKLAHLRYHLLCCIAYTFACLAWNDWAGQDQSFDQINYHVYNALAWWQGRIPEELFAASAQGYLNPLPHLPFFAALCTGWSSLAIASLMAVLHSINLWLVHAISAMLMPPVNRLNRLLIFVGVILGGLTPAFLTETGGSFVDVVVSIPALAALACTMYWLREQAIENDARADWRGLWLAAFLSGYACGLKPTAVVFALAMAFATLIVLRRMALAGLWRMLVGGILGLLLAGGSHALMLWRAFGNPVFPLFNAVFKSPWYASVNLVSNRFRPASLWEALCYPLDLADAYSRSGLEVMAVDYRPMALLLLLGILSFVHAVSRLRKHDFLLARPIIMGAPHKWLLCITLLLFVPAWLYTSANTRYALHAFLLLGPIFAWMALRLKGRSELWVLLAVALALATQSAATFMGNAKRWESVAWGREWFLWRIPAELRTQPAYYLSLQGQPFAVLALYLPPQSRFTNLLGQMPFNPSGAALRKIRQLRQIRRLPWRSLSVVRAWTNGGVPLDALENIDAKLSEYNLKVDRQDCKFIELGQGGTPPLHWTNKNTGTSLQYKAILTCLLVDAPPLSHDEVSLRVILDARFSEWEKRCPSIFAPSSPVSVQNSKAARMRSYLNTDVKIISVSGKLFIQFPSNEFLQLEDEQGNLRMKECPVLEKFGTAISSLR